MKRQAGFNLIEILVVVAIIGILMNVGWPLYIDQSRTNNRTDAIRATSAVALALNKFKSDTGVYTWTTPPGAVTAVNAHNRYLPQIVVGPLSDSAANDITCVNDRGFRWVPVPGRYESCRGNYSITVDIGPTIAAAPGSGDGTNVAYVITTTAIVARAQDDDLVCRSFTLDSNGVKGHAAGVSNNRPVEPNDPLVLQPGPNTDGQFHSTRRCWASD